MVRSIDGAVAVSFPVALVAVLVSQRYALDMMGIAAEESHHGNPVALRHGVADRTASCWLKPLVMLVACRAVRGCRRFVADIGRLIVLMDACLAVTDLTDLGRCGMAACIVTEAVLP